jgi:hypothetical protein
MLLSKTPVVSNAVSTAIGPKTVDPPLGQEAHITNHMATMQDPLTINQQGDTEASLPINKY